MPQQCKEKYQSNALRKQPCKVNVSVCIDSDSDFIFMHMPLVRIMTPGQNQIPNPFNLNAAATAPHVSQHAPSCANSAAD